MTDYHHITTSPCYVFGFTLDGNGHLLSVVSTIFMPVTFLTGIFGMNVAGLPGLNDPRAFYVVLGFMLLVGSGIVLWLHKKKWL